jgi:molybdenum cofactor biosynthesis enzyme MoaA
MNKSFCVIPWVQMASKPIGTARVCCLMTNSKDSQQGTIQDDNGVPYNLGQDDFDIIKNGAKAREIRLSMLKGERHSDCSTCWVKEDMGAPSRRTVSNKMYEGEFGLEQAQASTDSQGNTTWQPSYWDLRFGNLCNLKCVMCHPASSSQWYKDYILLNNKMKFTDSGTEINLKSVGGRYVDNGEYNWWDNPEFWSRLEEKIPYLKQVYLVGGEPMLIEPHYNFLQKVIDSGRADQVTLEYDTNLTAIHQRALNLWKHFKKVWLRISVDDYGDQFNYIRFPANWQQVSKNIEALSRGLPNVKIDFTITWQVLSSFTTLNLLDYLEKFPNHNYSIRILSNPEYYDAAILPSAAKEELIKIYTSWANTDSRRRKISHLINYLEKYKREDFDKLTKCVETLDKLDTIRSTNWRETFPQLSEYLNNEQ